VRDAAASFKEAKRMQFWQQFAVVAGAHFLALLSPGPDFFLVVRSAVRNGLRVASGVCVGIAVANGAYILLALAGFAALGQHSTLFTVLRWAGCAYLAWLGWQLLRQARHAHVAEAIDVVPRKTGWWREFATGFLSGILNPKNALFYAGLFSLVVTPATRFGVQLLYGVWMFCAVLLWDLALAAVIGRSAQQARFLRHARLLERLTGIVPLGLACGVAVSG
jgi:threonine/homoserine/homoserine lactone efflux protein